jgi:hypothetical protein
MRPVRSLAWVFTTALVVLIGRTIVYALSPSPLALHFEHAAGGPRLPAVTLAAAALGLGAACLVLWLAALGVRERRLLAPQPVPDPRPIRLPRVAARAVALYVAACTVFMLVESTIHWREGLGWHGIHCLVGPVHRNALPVLAALALVAAACAEALEHVLAWMRRTIDRLRSAGIRLAPSPAPLLAAPVSSPAGHTLPVRLRARGPPLA